MASRGRGPAELRAITRGSRRAPKKKQATKSLSELEKYKKESEKCEKELDNCEERLKAYQKETTNLTRMRRKYICSGPECTRLANVVLINCEHIYCNTCAEDEALDREGCDSCGQPSTGYIPLKLHP